MFESRAEKIAKLLELRKDGIGKNETLQELNSNVTRADADDNTFNKIIIVEDGQEVGGISESLAESNSNMNYYCTDADENTLNKIVMGELCQEIGGISELHEESNNNIVCTDEDENTIITIVMNGNCQGGSETSESANAEASTESDFNAEVSEIII
ncbi:hypothetical protein LSTR_LSTR002818 [Laodelphax striatellus]|uniref:Uncharacterized protein n=1 Tax=Laodelphax striatellus TaxID=195883 RepID=A0A482XH69_LAOST|nr:hypothetical protein LSTR_LSTR002818 [Laodelphax striatellus]